MEDGNANENQPSGQSGSTSKVVHRRTSEQDYDEKHKYDERGEDQVSNSETFSSGSFSVPSRVNMAGVKIEAPQLAVKQGKPQGKKKNRRIGRVQKRKRSTARRMTARRTVRRKPRKARDFSMSTIFTRLSSRSGSRTPGCKFCGHRCCRRRFEYEKRKKGIGKGRRIIRRKKDIIPRLLKGSKAVQVGSRSAMLSPLLINTNNTAQEEMLEKGHNFCEVTPEMIYEALRTLTMWRQYVQTAAILNYIKSNYPVNPEMGELTTEVMHKMRIAAVVGIAMEVAEGHWCLNCDLLNRSLRKSHVTMFWQVYADTMKPIKRPAKVNEIVVLNEPE